MTTPWCTNFCLFLSFSLSLFIIFVFACLLSHNFFPTACSFFYKLIWFHTYSQRSFFCCSPCNGRIFSRWECTLHEYVCNIEYLIFKNILFTFCEFLFNRNRNKNRAWDDFGIPKGTHISKKKNIDMVTIKNKNQLILNHFFPMKFQGNTIPIWTSFIFNGRSLGFHGSKWNANNSYPIDYYYSSKLLK